MHSATIIIFVFVVGFITSLTMFYFSLSSKNYTFSGNYQKELKSDLDKLKKRI